MNIKRMIHFLRSRPFIIAVLILIQLIFLFYLVFKLSEYFVPMYFILISLSFVMSIYIINKNENPSYKVTWIVVIATLPVFGGLVYLLFGGQKVPKELRIRDNQSHEKIHTFFWQDAQIMEELKEEDSIIHKQANLLWKVADYPIYRNTETTFFPLGEDKFKALVKELKKAKKFIFLEYFIIEEGIMWNTVLDILVEKVQQGVDVRVMYDDAGCIETLGSHYAKKLKKLGIKTKVFNPLRPRLAMQMNNRDHRKILVIDGIVAMTGGINLADEYINRKVRFGHWKDCGVMIKGEAVWSFTVMFLQFWNYDEKNKENFFDYKAKFSEIKHFKQDGLVQPFSDSPTDRENVGEYAHINMINGANKYVYATTPYLIIDNEMKTALTLAAKNGVDVRIIVPHIPDKKYAFALTQHTYKDLIKAGVRIYEYTPGFIHSKCFVSDDKVAIVGTINMDYRSYYLHYECGVLFYKSKVVDALKEDYIEILAKSQEVTLEQCLNVPILKRIVRAILNLFAPMM